MRSRSNSGVRLDFYQRLVNKTILRHQNAVTGLLPATDNHPHAWTRDNVYSILAVWGLALAYRKNADLDEDRAKAYELEQSVVKLMRGLLQSMMLQCDKLEKFKQTQNPLDALHAKYSVTTGHTVVGDREWGHLQIDATSLYLLILAEMTASGLQIIFTLDEVAFIQNLVFYIQSAYRIPDYGIWERGDKTNHGVPELNASSIGMAKAALEAITEVDLFGARGGPASVIHVLPDEAMQCQAILQSMLPRESNSKEVDAAILAVISYPAFAVDDPELIERTKEKIVEKLQGNYGFCRFLRDGYKTPVEDPNRLHYEPWELQIFEQIECEWPIFYAYFILDGLFQNDREQVEEYKEALDEIMLKGEDGLKIMPELYTVTADKVDLEKREPHSQSRVASGKIPHMWGQSLYVLARLLIEGFLSPGELDPLNRRLVAEPKPDLVVQVVILAEDTLIQDKLDAYGLKVQTVEEVYPIRVLPARALSQIYSQLGKSKKLGLSGRPSDEVGLLATSKLYMIQNQIFAFMPQFLDQHSFYLPLDMALLTDVFKTDINTLGTSWNMMGRPTMIFPITKLILDFTKALQPALISTIKKLQSGYINGTRVMLGNLQDFLDTSCITNLTFLAESDEMAEKSLFQIIDAVSPSCKRPRLLSVSGSSRIRRRRMSVRAESIRGIIKRTRSIQIDPNDIPDLSALLQRSTSVTSSDGTDYADSSPTSPTSMCPPTISLTAPGETTTGHPHLRGRSDSPVDALHEFHLPHGEDGKPYDSADVEEIIESLKTTESLHEQADIIHYLFVSKGPSFDTAMGGKHPCTVKDLLTELYEKAGHMKQWWLVRHTAGMLRKRVEDLAKAATDILVRQKQLAVGLPPEPREKIITRPLPPEELASIIHAACGEDSSTAMLTQELLIYLAMFIRTEPKLFHEMLRLRVGLIIQVMASELARTLKCSGEEASDHLLNLSPFEMKTLLHHILSGKEFGVSTENDSIFLSPGEIITRDRRKSAVQTPGQLPLDTTVMDQFQDQIEADRQGQWLRRRRLDGALNRVPVGFYSQNWVVLKRCHGLSIAGYILPQSLTSEMTSGELKFALQVEMALNRIPQPEYRQLMVEAMMVLTLIVENDHGKVPLNYVIAVDKLVAEANEIFIQDQREVEGDSILCCAQANAQRTHGHLKCGGTAGICQHFYDSAPSGRYGTLSYMCRACTNILHMPVTDDGETLDCIIA